MGEKNYIGAGKLCYAVLDENGKAGEYKECPSIEAIPKLELGKAIDKAAISMPPVGYEESISFDIPLSMGSTIAAFSLFFGVPSRRCYHLALHGKKERTRKKNRKRLFKYWR